MSEKVVLPKFDLPGKQIHPAVKLLWMVGGLLLLSMLALGGALWRHHSMEVAEENRKQAEIAAKTAQANAELEAAKARQAEAAAQVAARESEGRRPRSAAKREAAAGRAKVAATAVAGRHHGGGHHGAGNEGREDDRRQRRRRMTRPRPARSPRKKGDDVVDKLLASFK